MAHTTLCCDNFRARYWRMNPIMVLDVAANRESLCPGIGARVEILLRRRFRCTGGDVA